MTKADCFQKCIEDGNWKWPQGRRLTMAVPDKSGKRCCSCSSALCKGVYKSLADELCWMSWHWSGTTFSSKLKRLSLALTVYHIWRARNLIIFQNDSVAAISIVAAILKDMQTIVTAWKKIPRTKANWNLVLEWNSSLIVLSLFDELVLV
ncbi:hypothetical protein ACH5RR_030124 [Cinchona calisaya]|uniref:Uncharacterized protein n=1 Tax=Cinchona calisaya TaxID=153742 RepID=A0ABD2YYX1_9GENT